ncbi:MAG: DUF3465 domain-containing protein [Candidatus Eremiobacteraeota bacterium]|nr:DUF3465 domain-containing protein [Candidatus Eremiobacteraeota bacterium]
MNSGSHPDTLANALDACRRGASHAEVKLSGVMNKVLGMRRGPSGSHEGFILLVKGGPGEAEPDAYKVEDNIDITGFIALRRGDRIELMGQYECNDGVIHWTHHDPRGRHIAGYIKVNGRTYQ